MKNFSYIFLLVALMISTNISVANNITVSNVSLTGQNTGSQYSLVQFDINWENSWRVATSPSNWDAAWVFVKYRVQAGSGGDGLWHHASLNDAGHTAPSGSTIDIGLLTPATAFNSTTNPGLGAFIYRNADGTGTNTWTGAQLRWNYGVNYKTGTTPIGNNDLIDIQVFAIEMVYVPAGNFYVGDGTTTNVSGQFTAHNTTGNFQITSESVPATLGGTSPGNLGNNNSSAMNPGDDFNDNYTQLLPAAFPKGYNAFYCMKYEISQQGYVDFLNNLTTTQATNRFLWRYPENNRYGITVASNVYSTTLPYVACNWLSWADAAAFLDWSGLRPMTELEFEKACRGTVTAVANEYAWGSISITQNIGITNSGLTNETSTNSGNCTYGLYGSVPGPMRVGALATSSSSRSESGATYYGIMEMSGNLFEFPVTVGNATGRTFTGAHGNGALDATGDADASTWPGTDAAGTGRRGGAWSSTDSAVALRVSERDNATNGSQTRSSYAGGRGVRITP